MYFTPSYVELAEVAVKARARLRQKQEKPTGQRQGSVLDDLSFRRLLRDGHHADATAYLLAELEDAE
jgi:hypothetical protein